MSALDSVILWNGAFRLGLLAVGALFGFLGYRLFASGLMSPTGDLTAQWKDTKLLIKRAAPGTFFACFGAAIIIVGIVHGVKYDEGGYLGGLGLLDDHNPEHSQKAAKPNVPLSGL